MGLNNSIIGQQLLNLGKVYIASNKPENKIKMNCRPIYMSKIIKILEENKQTKKKTSL